MAKKRPAPREFDVLRALWDLGPSRVREVRDHLEASGSKLAYNTVQTLLNRLVDKGQVRVDARDSAFVYRAAVQREKVYGARIRELVQDLFDGSAMPLVSHLVRDGKLEKSDVEELAALLDGEVRKKKRSSRK